MGGSQRGGGSVSGSAAFNGSLYEDEDMVSSYVGSAFGSSNAGPSAYANGDGPSPYHTASLQLRGGGSHNRHGYQSVAERRAARRQHRAQNGTHSHGVRSASALAAVTSGRAHGPLVGAFGAPAPWCGRGRGGESQAYSRVRGSVAPRPPWASPNWRRTLQLPRTATQFAASRCCWT